MTRVLKPLRKKRTIKKKLDNRNLLAKNDAIKIFIEYALSQGSQSASKYFMIFTSMQYKALYPVEYKKCKSFRDTLTGFDLEILKMSDVLIANAIYRGLEADMPYKNIYRAVKREVESFALSFGNCLVRSLLNKN